MLFSSKEVEMQIEYLPLDALTPYENNPRNNDAAVAAVAASIRSFGFKVPIVIDRCGVIVTGHTRLKAAKRLGLQTVPCIRAADLTPEQVRAFRLADNKVAEKAAWDPGRLEIELDALELDVDMDMSDFGFELGQIEPIEAAAAAATTEEPEDDGWYGDERARTTDAYNRKLIDRARLTDDRWQMPVLRPEHRVPADLIGFNYAKTSDHTDAGVHFYVDDYQFERVWNRPERYVDLLFGFDCVLTPDFSLYTEMTTPIKIWNVWRSRLLGAYWQKQGLIVIPTLQWCEEAGFDYCFTGLPKESVVSVSTIGVKRDENALALWRAGMDEAIARLHPETILLYGGRVDYDFGDIRVVEYGNHVLDAWKGE